MATRQKLVAIVGPTASGKSALAMELARRFNGEIICADSRTIYKGMDIGTAKPSLANQKQIPHHLIDIVEPDQPFSVADFKEQAEAAIDQIIARGRLPILVGGSGLYVDSVLFDYQFSSQSQDRDKQNPRHLAKKDSRNDLELRPNTFVIGIDVQSTDLQQLIAQRIDTMLDDGLVEEANKLSQKYGWDIEAMKTYLPLRAHLEQGDSLEDAKEQLIIKDRQLAKKQRTWFKRNKSIQWQNNPKKAVALVTTFLNKSL